uniref:Uncharacterized protein n=1 Tax=Romanomermis culicivorax TaxID=13658 RepID=A0A915IXT7_ROMCU
MYPLVLTFWASSGISHVEAGTYVMPIIGTCEEPRILSTFREIGTLEESGLSRKEDIAFIADEHQNCVLRRVHSYFVEPIIFQIFERSAIGYVVDDHHAVSRMSYSIFIQFDRLQFKIDAQRRHVIVAKFIFGET